MKNIKQYIIVAFLPGIALLSSCTANFERIHDGYFGITQADLAPDNKMVGAGYEAIMKNVYYNTGGWDYQTYQNLNADNYSGYMSAPGFAGANNLTYFMNSGWNDDCWGFGYNVMKNWLTNQEVGMQYGFPDVGFIEDKNEALAKDWKESIYKHFIAVNTVCKVLGMSRLADQYGPIIYSKWGNTDLLGVSYDPLKDIYTSFFSELAEAVEVLDWAANTDDKADFAPFDMVYKGDFKKWARLANSLRARLAMRIVKVDSAEAQKQFEAAVAAPQGTMGEGDTYTLDGHNWPNPLFTCSIAYTDCAISANIESILGGYEDPRLLKFATPVKATGKVKGFRTGLPDTAEREPKGERKVQYLPHISLLNIPDINYRSIVVYGAETLFLKAEAALRGWNIGEGTAQSFYEAGVTASFKDWGLAVESYLASTKTPAAYVDPLFADFNIAAMSTVTPKWDEALTNEQKLEKIITQKWIAGFPEGMNAWAEYRRTGYPKQFPIIDNRSPAKGAFGHIDTNLGVRRLPYTVAENTGNKAGVEGAVKHLGGPDLASTRLWWDVDKANF